MRRRDGRRGRRGRSEDSARLVRQIVPIDVSTSATYREAARVALSRSPSAARTTSRDPARGTALALDVDGETAWRVAGAHLVAGGPALAIELRRPDGDALGIVGAPGPDRQAVVLAPADLVALAEQLGLHVPPPRTRVADDLATAASGDEADPSARARRRSTE